MSYAITIKKHFKGEQATMHDDTQPEEVQHIPVDTIIQNIGQLVTMAQQPIAGATGQVQVLANAAVAAHKGFIVWIGSNKEVESLFLQNFATEPISLHDAQERVVTPGFVDSHTHLVFAGD